MKHHVTAIYIYPIKSLGGISMQTAQLCATGLKYDRRWMLVDSNNRFISQREFHSLCLFSVELLNDHFTVSYQHETIDIPLSLDSGETLSVMIWDDTVPALSAPGHINQWFSKHLQQSVTLVYMPDETHRNINPKYVAPSDKVSFADGYPVLVIGEASLNLLQSKVTEAIPMNRFRPNIVFNETEAHEEDTWKTFVINDLTYKGVKPCGRCVVTTINQQTGKANAEPLKTLAGYRKFDNSIWFGQNVITPLTGTINVGDAITVTDYIDVVKTS